MTVPRVALSGYYGYGNAGDEAVLAGLIRSLRLARPDVDICILSGGPAETQRTHSVGAAHRYRPAELLSTLRRTDALLSGGGSLLQDVTSPHSVFYYLGVVRLAQILGKKTMFAAQGIGPLRLPRSRKLTATVANRCDALTVRDPASAELLTKIGVHRPIEVTADPALILSPPEPIIRRHDCFGVALRPWQGHAALPGAVADVCAQVMPEARAMLVSMQKATDSESVEQFGAQWRQTKGVALYPPGVELSKLLHNIGLCQLMVGMRLHALILAATCGVPSVALAYDPKVTAFMAQSGQADAVWNMETDNTDALAGLMARAWTERMQRADALRALLPDLQVRARRTAEVAIDLLK